MTNMSLSDKSDFLSTGIRAARLAGALILNNLGRISKNDVYIKQVSR